MVSDEEKAELERLIRAHDGNSAAIARALTDAGQPITRQAVSQRIHKAKLEHDADIARAQAGIAGQRYTLPDHVLDPEGEKAIMLRELVRGPDRGAAAERLKMSRRNMYRKMKRYGITDETIRAAGVGA